MRPLARRPFLTGAASLLAAPAAAAQTVDLGLPGGPSTRPLTSAFPQKGRMILQRTSAPLLETPMEVFDEGVFTPNDRFYVRWHWASFPTRIDPSAFQLAVHGLVAKTLTLSLHDLQHGFPQIEIAAVNQCAGNSRGLAQPRVAGAQWGNGAMGNALWRGVRLKDVLDRAGVKPGAKEVRFQGLDETDVPGAPRFRKAIALDHARDGEVLIATAMNGAPLPVLNGFPVRLIVPGWYATYWVKMLSDIEITDQPDDNFWMAKAYRIPDTEDGGTTPGGKPGPTRPIGPMVPRSFVTSLADGTRLKAHAPHALRGIAFGGASAVSAVDISTDGGKSWHAARLGPDQGTYGFRRWSAPFAPGPGATIIAVRATNRAGQVQPAASVWNPSGYMRNGIEHITVEGV